MSAIFTAIISIFKRHKLKLFSIPLFALAWVFFIFPYGDLVDLVSTKVSAASGGALYLDMDSISLSFLPIGARLEKVAIDAQQLPTISVAALTLTPSIASLLAFRPGGSIRAEGLFKGDADVEYSQGDKAKSGERVQNVSMRLEKVSLSSVNEILRTLTPMDLSLKGAIIGTGSVSLDPSYSQPPAGVFNLALAGFSANLVNLIGMELTFAQAQLSGNLGDGKLRIDKGDFGNAKDELNGNVKGTIDLAVTGPGGRLRVDPGAYDLIVSLNASDAVVRRLGLFLDQIAAQGGRAEKTATGYAYRFRTVPGPGGLPRYMSPEG